MFLSGSILEFFFHEPKQTNMSVICDILERKILDGAVLWKNKLLIFFQTKCNFHKSKRRQHVLEYCGTFCKGSSVFLRTGVGLSYHYPPPPWKRLNVVPL